VTQPRIAAFARLANGNVAPARIIDGQATRLGRTIHGIDYHERRDEIVVPNPIAAAVLVFAGGAVGDAAPVRTIQGPRTRLVYPHTVSFDPANEEIVVVDLRRQAILIFPVDADGDAAPRRVIEGSNTRLRGATIVGAAVDPASGLLVAAATSTRGGETGLFVFDRLATGDVAPKAVIAGPATRMSRTLRPRALTVRDGQVFVGVVGGGYGPPYDQGFVDKPRVTSADQIPPLRDVVGFVGMWHISDRGDVPPRAVLAGPHSQLVYPGGVAVNTAKHELFVVDSTRNGLFAFSIPQFLSPAHRGSTGSVRQTPGGARLQPRPPALASMPRFPPFCDLMF
jgi:DNA-binding beta-propeller fold protein YncE